MSPLLRAGCFWGTPTRSLQVGIFHATETSYTPDLRLPAHAHEHPYFTYVVRGGYSEDASGSVRECARGAVVFHPAGESHANRFTTLGGRCFNLELFAGAWPAQITGLGGMVCRGDVEWTAMRIWREFQRPDGVSPLSVEELIHLLVAHLVAARSSRHAGGRWLGHVTEFLHAHALSHHGLAEIARVGGVHPMHLVRAFRRRHGCSVGEFVRRRRIEWACDQLQRNEATISRLAVEAGFADHPHFARVFKRVTGFTPSAYRALARAS